MSPLSLEKIISGGQTGVDRGALDAALAAGFPCGGWCPAGRKAEDGPIPDRYPVTETGGACYAERTRRNVIDSDATLVIYFGELVGGTEKTARLCGHLGKPVLLLDGLERDPEAVAASAADFVMSHGTKTLNVAGPRESGYAGAQQFAARAVTSLLAKVM
jgi:hypothetical protein